MGERGRGSGGRSWDRHTADRRVSLRIRATATTEIVSFPYVLC